jgi:hypothetical protein
VTGDGTTGYSTLVTASVGNTTWTSQIIAFQEMPQINATLVQSAEGTSATATTNPAFSVAPTAGNLIFLGFSSEAYNASVDAGWTESTSMGIRTGANHGLCGWWRISNGSNSFAYTIGGANKSAWVMAEFANVTATPYDVSASTFTNTGQANNATPSITPTTGPRLVIAALGLSNAAPGDGLMGNDPTAITNQYLLVRSAGMTGASGDVLHVSLVYNNRIVGNGSTATSTQITHVANNQVRTSNIIALKTTVGGGGTNVTVSTTGSALAMTAGNASVTTGGGVNVSTLGSALAMTAGNVTVTAGSGSSGTSASTRHGLMKNMGRMMGN